ATYPVVGKTADGSWLQITVNNQTGWVSAQYVTVSGDLSRVPVVSPDVGGGAATPPPPTGVRGRVMGNLRIRQGPSTRTPQIGLMPWGTEVDILGRDSTHSWYQVNFDGLVGWSYAPWIRLIEGSFDMLPYTDGTEPVFPPPPATEGVVAQAFGNMRIRSGPGFEYPKISKAIWGTRVQVLARSTNGLWYKVQYGDLVGWSYAAWYRIVQGDVMTLPVTNQ
ncbi:MAG: SH3 domain-containing protein, partial [Anaerolineae bacterium]|nr:SH3 domain-containing protein [Anaerolineae bacterium]